ncbi:sensor histidine kinase [Actinosynnema sp. NPDC020468]|uniref:sensor histidine kinase n=1 Tax=Actinosynnema sp. NPDC020468 TaxID=3154488 RepID=UPI0033C99A93
MIVGAMIALVSLSYLTAGAASQKLRPGNTIGILMLIVGTSWTLDHLLTDVPFPVLLLARVWPAILGHLLIAYPTGRLETPGRRTVVAAGYTEMLTLVTTGYYAPPGEHWAEVAQSLEVPITSLVGFGMLSALFHRWRTSTVAQRRTLTAMLGASAVAIISFALWEPASRTGHAPPGIAFALSLSSIPFAYLTGLLRRRFDRANVADLVVRLNNAEPPNVRDALADTLHDPTLQIAYWVPTHSHYVHADGTPLHPKQPHPTQPHPTQTHTRVDRAGTPVAILLHDPVLDSELVEAACAAVGLALENERLAADLRARLRQLAESRAKVLSAAETERRRLERDLHDGVQQRLLAVAMTLALAETVPTHRSTTLLTEAKTSVLATIDDLRALCNGLHPPILTERGLPGAVRELTALTDVDLALTLDTPLPPEIETTAYYVVAEALANATKHADATRTSVTITGGPEELTIRVDDNGTGGADPSAGSGLRGLADRVEATGGTMRVLSDAEGTSVRVVLPCGS